MKTSTLYRWRAAYNEYGPAALEEKKRGARAGSRLSEPTKRAILMPKAAHPEWGCERLSDVLWRSEGHAAIANAIAHFLEENGFVAPPAPESEPHAPLVHHFERARGTKHVLARPRHPKTVGKAERFWGSLWRECLELAQFRSVEEARLRVGLSIDHYNFHRPHQGIDGLTPADRFFEAAPEVLRTLKGRVTPRAGELARDGLPRKSFYLTGRIGDAGIPVHAEGERIVLTTEDGHREEALTVRRSAYGQAPADAAIPASREPACEPFPSFQVPPPAQFVARARNHHPSPGAGAPCSGSDVA